MQVRKWHVVASMLLFILFMFTIYKVRNTIDSCNAAIEYVQSLNRQEVSN